MITYILLYIGIYIFLCFGVWFIQRRSDGSRKLPPLEVPTETPNPYEFAALRAGRHEIVRLFLFELIATGLIALTTDQKGKVTKQSQLRRTDKEPNEVPELSPEGQYFFSWFAVKRAPSFVFDSSPLQSLAEQWTKKFNIRFDEERLVLSRHGRCISWITLLCAIVLSFGVFLAIRQTLDLGQANFFVGAFFFTFAGWVAGTIVLALVFIPRKLSYRGKRYVKAVQEHFRPFLSPQVNDGKTADAMFAVAIMGVPILAGTAFAEFGTLFSSSTVTIGGCGGGCGHGCGGGCSGCGGGCGD